MAASVDIIINAIDKTQSTLKGVGQGFKSVGATLAIATGTIYAANAALDNLEARLNDLGFSEQANQIADAQQAWQSLADTILTFGTFSGVFDVLLNGLKTAGTAASQLVFLLGVGAIELKKVAGLLSEQEAAQQKINLAGQYNLAQERSATADTKKRTDAFKKQNDELQRQLDKYNQINDALQEGIRRRDPAAIRKAESDMTKLNAENPNAVALGKSGVTVVINGGGMKDVVTGVIVNGIQQEPNYLDPTRGY